jgi:trk system potassium uptake protein TrkH
MRYRVCLVNVAWILVYCSIAMVVPGLVALLQLDLTHAIFFVVSAVVTGFVAGATLFTLRGTRQSSERGELILTPVLAWFIVPVFAALPFLLSGTVNSFADGYFEAVSGITTTGATILTNLGDLSPSIIFWRAWMQWLGGLATLVMVMSMFAYLDIGGMQVSTNLLKHGEGETIIDRIRGIIRTLWMLYTLLTLVCMILLWSAGMPFFDGICIAMSTLSTGGFMPRDGTMISYGKPMIEVVLVPFMLIGAINFSLHWSFMQGRFGVYRQEPEVRRLVVYSGVSILLLIILLSTGLGQGDGLPILQSIRSGVFTAISMISTTGFISDDAAIFPLSPALLIMPLILLGGTTGSTSGGIKMLRLQVLFMHSKREFARLSHPHGVTSTSYRGRRLDDDVMTGIWSFFILLILTVCGLTVLLSATGLSLHSSVAAVVATITNTGPAVTLIDASLDGYHVVSEAGKFILSFSMVAGRLEILPLFILLAPGFWRS